MKYKFFSLLLFIVLFSRLAGAQAPDPHGDFYTYEWFHQAVDVRLCHADGACGPYECTITFRGSLSTRLQFAFSRESVRIYNLNTGVGYRDEGWNNHIVERINNNGNGSSAITPAPNMSSDELQKADISYREMSTMIVTCLVRDIEERRARARQRSV
jgi:hypothetical protein